MRYAFFGTSTFSVAILEKLVSDFYRPELVVTQPDRPAGRKRILTPPPVKAVCEDHCLPILQPANVREAEKALTELKLDLLIVAAYGQIIPKHILQLARLGAINVHASLLPHHRGASPIQTAILNGDRSTGITIMQMDEKMDHGAILFQKSLPISSTDTYRSLQAKLSTLGADVLAKTLPDISASRMRAYPQNESEVTYTRLLTKADAQINWQAAAETTDHQVRAFYDWPLAWTTLSSGKKMNILKAQPVQLEKPLPPGTLIIQNDQAAIACGQGALLLQEVHVEGKQKTAGDVFARGYHTLNGTQCR